MDSLRTEEEQVAALKQFWKEYGSAILLGVLISLASVYGWKAWQGHKVEQSQISSGLYQELLDISLRQPGQPLDEQQQASFDNLLQTLKDDHKNTVYMQFAVLLKASKAVQNDDLEAAKEHLEWLLLQKPGHDIAVLTRLRLARVLLAQPGADTESNATEALALINQIEQPGAFKTSYEDVRGDVLLALGRRDEARQAYQLAADLAVEYGEARPLVTLKLDDLAQAKEK